MDNRLPQTNTTVREAYKIAEHTKTYAYFTGISILFAAMLRTTDSRTRRYLFACLSYFWDEGTQIPSENSHLKVLILQRGDIARTS